ncbi:hypothetical protein V3C99_006840 [Haemonchus contortus]
MLPIENLRPSIAKHSSFSSGITTPNGEVTRSLRRLSSIPADFCCSICMNIFRKPSMLTCGHSFCAECIEHWLNENVSCPTCRTDTHTPIRNIALEQVVEEFQLSKESRVRFSKQANGCEPSGYASLNAFLRRQAYRASRRRTRFSINGPEILVDGPGSSTEALPATSREASYRSLGSLPRVDLDMSEDDLLCDAKPVTFRRRFLRDGRKSVSGRDVHLSIAYDSENSDVAVISPFKRASLFRRSICAIRKSVSRRHRRRDVQGLSESGGFTNEETVASREFEEPVSSSVEPIIVADGDMTKTKKSKWKRFFSFKLRKVHPTRGNDKNEQSSFGHLCVYSGFGRSFERIHPGDEIAIAVFGSRGVGKTSLLDNATLSCEGRHGIAPLGLTERMRLGGRNNHSEYRFAHMTSITVETRNRTLVIDLIDAEFEDDHSVVHTSYMRAADATFLLYSCSDSASLLAAMSIHRQLAAIVDCPKPCVLLANVMGGTSQRYVTREMGERTARNIRATYLETNLLMQDGIVLKAVEHLCREVLRKRRNADGKDVCSLM